MIRSGSSPRRDRAKQPGKPYRPASRARPTALSLYTGAGGFDLGLEAAGFEIVGCVEKHPDARATIEESTNWPLIGEPAASPGDIQQLEPSEILAAFDLKPRRLTLL